MGHAHGEHWRLPVISVDGVELVVDLTGGRFIRLGGDGLQYGSIRFASREGQSLWEQLMIVHCPLCRAAVVTPRHGCDGQCHRCHQVLPNL